MPRRSLSPVLTGNWTGRSQTRREQDQLGFLPESRRCSCSVSCVLLFRHKVGIAPVFAGACASTDIVAIDLRGCRDWSKLRPVPVSRRYENSSSYITQDFARGSTKMPRSNEKAFTMSRYRSWCRPSDAIATAFADAVSLDVGARSSGTSTKVGTLGMSPRDALLPTLVSGRVAGEQPLKPACAHDDRPCLGPST